MRHPRQEGRDDSWLPAMMAELARAPCGRRAPEGAGHLHDISGTFIVIFVILSAVLRRRRRYTNSNVIRIRWLNLG